MLHLISTRFVARDLQTFVSWSLGRTCWRQEIIKKKISIHAFKGDNDDGGGGGGDDDDDDDDDEDDDDDDDDNDNDNDDDEYRLYS